MWKIVVRGGFVEVESVDVVNCSIPFKHSHKVFISPWEVINEECMTRVCVLSELRFF